MKQFHNKHHGERCFILGNGPSLKNLDWKILEGETWFGTNRIYLSGHEPTYYVAVNPLVINQYIDEIDQLKCTRFLSGGVGGHNVINLDTTLNYPAFSSPAGPIWEGHTVTYVCLQLAFYMGFKEVILLGVDHYYGEVLRPNLEVVATGVDEHHFHPDYFSGGKRWNLPDLRMSELAYTMAKYQYEKYERTIINCTERTNLKVFPILPLNYVISRIHPKISAIVSAYYAEDKMDALLEDQCGQLDAFHETVIVCQKGSPEWRKAIEFQDRMSKMWCTIVETEDIPTIYRAWNLGIQFASGEFLTNANTDDRHHPQAYSMMAEILTARPDIDVVYHDSYITWGEEDYGEFLEKYHGKRLANGRVQNQPGIFAWPEYDRSLLSSSCFLGPHPMWRANLHQRYGGFLDHYQVAGDYEFWLRCSEHANMMHIPYPLGLYRASLKGKELSSPEIARNESIQAIYLHQTPESNVIPVDPDTIRMNMGDEWSYFQINELYSILNQIKENNK